MAQACQLSVYMVVAFSFPQQNAKSKLKAQLVVEVPLLKDCSQILSEVTTSAPHTQSHLG